MASVLLAMLMIVASVRSMRLSGDPLHLLPGEIFLASLPVLMAQRFFGVLVLLLGFLARLIVARRKTWSAQKSD